MKNNAVFEKNKRFAIRVIKLYKYLTTEKQELIMAKQIMRSGTSIGANISEADVAISKS